MGDVIFFDQSTFFSSAKPVFICRCDVFTAVRKLRAQRQGMIQELALYEFVYRAISDYVDLYRNKDEEYEYSVPVGAVNNSGTTKSVKSVQSAKSNGSGPYCMPVGSTNTGKSSDTYENFGQVKGASVRIPEEGDEEVRVLVHQEREEQEGSTGSQSPPLDCTGASLINSEPR